MAGLRSSGQLNSELIEERLSTEPRALALINDPSVFSAERSGTSKGWGINVDS